MKNKGLWIRTAIIVVITLVGVYFVFGPRHIPTGHDFTWQGVKDNLAANINLGLDLRGGSHLVMRVKTDEYLKTLTENDAQSALTTAQDAKLPVSGVTNVATDGNYSITLSLTDPAQAQAVIDEVRKKVDFTAWTESNNGSSINWSLPVQAQNTLKDEATEQALKIIEGRINAFGVKEPTLQRQGSKTSGQILLQMPGVDDPERVKKLIGETSKLMLMKLADGPYSFPTKEAAIQSLGGTIPPNRLVLPHRESDDDPNTPKQPNQPPKDWMIVETPPIIDGSEMSGARPTSRTGAPNDYQIEFFLKPAAGQKFGEWTGKNIKKYLAIVLNDEVKSAPVINGQIFDTGQIEGKFTKTSADDLSLTLKSGALPAKVEYQEERTVGPSLGADSIRAGVEASLGGLALVIVFMLFYYRGAGINAVLALVMNMVLTIAALVLIKSTLTLPGIAGLILGIGMAVDSNVLIFERIREELRLGLGVAESISLGFDRAFVTIIDTHITTIISSLILYFFGSGPIRGFAVTLILGLLINLFTAVFVSRTIFNWELSLRPNLQKLSI
ncbi:MAG: protein translocase subunit SecD [Acidobacteriota bacterium]